MRPLKGKFYQVYQATVEQKSEKIIDSFVGIREKDFKSMCNQNTSTFKLEHKRSETTLSEHNM